MHKSSDGQRRRVQICMGLLRPYKVATIANPFNAPIKSCISAHGSSEISLSVTKKVLLLDEITVDLDVLARSNLLKFLKKECEVRGATIIYATHIFDGLDDWPSHIVCLMGPLRLICGHINSFHPHHRILGNCRFILLMESCNWRCLWRR